MTKRRTWPIFRGIAVGVGVVFIISITHGLAVFNGTCGMDLGNLGSSVHTCSIFEFVTSRYELPFFIVLWAVNYWYIVLSCLALSVAISAYVARRKPR